MSSSVKRLLVLGAFFPMVAFADPQWLTYLKKNVFQRIQLSGERRLTYRTDRVTGDREAYNQLNYYGSGAKRFTNFGLIGASGRNVAGLINFQATILDSRITDPQGQHFSIDYVRKGWTVNLGDVQASLLNTNRFTTFNRAMRGAQVGYTGGRLQAKVMRSDTKGDVRSVVIQGNNSAGPYYLQSSQIVRDSEEVRVDGQQMKLGVDYVVNYEVGSITFISRIIAPTSAIVVSYESLTFNARAGIIQGAGVTYDLGNLGRLGVNALQQLPRGGGKLGRRLEKFQGFGAPSTPYFLQFEPLNVNEVEIRVNGVLQGLGVDYLFDSGNQSIFYFTRFMPAENNIDVLYTPKPQGQVEGDRESYGVDYRLKLGPKGAWGSVGFAIARGLEKNTTNGLHGTARGADLLLTRDKWTVTSSVRDVPSSYVTVETRGFNRNERALDFDIKYRATRKLTYGLSHSNSSIANRTTKPDGTFVFTPSRSTIARFNADYQPESGSGGWRFEQRRVESVFQARSTRLDISEFRGTRDFGKLRTQYGLVRQSGFAPKLDGTTYRRVNVELDSAKFGFAFNPSNRWTLNATSSLSAIRSDGKRGSGVDITTGVSYRPSERLTLNSTFVTSDSGSLATLGLFQNGYGSGYDGNGFSGTPGVITPLGATDATTWLTTLEFRPSDRLSLVARYNRFRSKGSVSSNSESSNYGTTASIYMGAPLTLSASLDRSETKFIESALRSSATSLTLAADGGLGRTSYRAGFSSIINGGNSTFRQNSTQFESSIDYRIARRHNLSFQASLGSLTGYLPQKEWNTSATYQYRIWQSLAFNLRYNFRDVKNKDATVTSGAYRAHGIQFELAFNFGFGQ